MYAQKPIKPDIQGKNEQGQEMSRRGPEGMEKVLGMNEAGRLRSSTSLARALRHQGQCGEAEEPEIRETDAGRRFDFGPDLSSHPDSNTGSIDIASEGNTLSCESSSASFVWPDQPHLTTLPPSFPSTSIPDSKGQTPVEKLASSFLRHRNERIRITNKICRFLLPSEISIRERIDDSLRMEKVGLYLANQRLLLESSVPDGVNQVGDQGDMDNIDEISDKSEGSNDGANNENEGIGETSFELVHAELEAAAKFLTSGRPFILYKERLRNFLNQQCRPGEEPRPTLKCLK